MPAKLSHYYGNIVRMIFMMGAIIMVIGLPVLYDLINLPMVVSVASILILGLAAGLTNPAQKWDATINVLISCGGFIVFEMYAIDAYYRALDPKFFFVNLILGFLFLVATYFSVKTLRGIVQGNVLV